MVVVCSSCQETDELLGESKIKSKLREERERKREERERERERKKERERERIMRKESSFSASLGSRSHLELGVI